VAAARTAVEIIREAIPSACTLSKRELSWLDRIEEAVGGMPAEEELIEEMKETYGQLFSPASYGLE
jgi:hypothetical protein